MRIELPHQPRLELGERDARRSDEQVRERRRLNDVRERRPPDRPSRRRCCGRSRRGRGTRCCCWPAGRGRSAVSACRASRGRRQGSPPSWSSRLRLSDSRWRRSSVSEEPCRRDGPIVGTQSRHVNRKPQNRPSPRGEAPILAAVSTPNSDLFPEPTPTFGISSSNLGDGSEMRIRSELGVGSCRCECRPADIAAPPRTLARSGPFTSCTCRARPGRGSRATSGGGRCRRARTRSQRSSRCR